MGVESADVDMARHCVSSSGRHEVAPGSPWTDLLGTNKQRKDVEDPDAGGVISGMPSHDHTCRARHTVSHTYSTSGSDKLHLGSRSQNRSVPAAEAEWTGARGRGQEVARNKGTQAA